MSCESLIDLQSIAGVNDNVQLSSNHLNDSKIIKNLQFFNSDTFAKIKELKHSKTLSLNQRESFKHERIILLGFSKIKEKKFNNFKSIENDSPYIGKNFQNKKIFRSN